MKMFETNEAPCSVIEEYKTSESSTNFDKAKCIEEA